MNAGAQDLDALIQRLKDKAALAEAEDSLALQHWVRLWQERLTSIGQVQPERYYVSTSPRMAELISAHQDDSIFIQRIYMIMTGRQPDIEGIAYYQHLTTQEGRIPTLVTLLQSEEVQTYIHKEHLQLPMSLGRLNRCYLRLSAIPLIGLRCWKMTAWILWQCSQQRWYREGEYYQNLIYEEKRHKDFQALSMTLKEMAHIQSLIVDQLSTPNSSSNLPEQAREVAEMLEKAKQALEYSARDKP